MIQSEENHKVYKIALLVSLACVLQISESLIPHPIPGLRLGLANMVTLTALVTLGFGYALQIAILRTILSSFIMGTFMSPTFILSFSGAVISTLVMGLFYWLSSFHKHYRLSIIGISIVGALSHNIVQLHLAYAILVRHRGIFAFLPWLSVGAVITGWFTGLVAGGVCRKLKEIQKQEVLIGMQPDFPVPLVNHYVAGNSLLHRLPAEIKIASIFILSLLILVLNSLLLYAGLFFFLSLVVISSRTSLAFLYSRAKRYTSLVLVAFLLPLFFNSGTHILLNIPYLKITHEGLSTGTVFAFRILFLILSSSLLMRTTSPEEMTTGLGKVLAPLRCLGISEKRVATILYLSWTAIPFIWEKARLTIRAANLRKTKNFHKLIPLLSNLIASLYLETEPESRPGKNASAEQEKRVIGRDTPKKTYMDSPPLPLTKEAC